MSNIDSIETVSSDTPVTDPANDRLGYSVFARQLATSLLKMRSPEGYVIAITGQWGIGKSTVAKLLDSHRDIHALKQLVAE